jgi:hypothetical protein
MLDDLMTLTDFVAHPKSTAEMQLLGDLQLAMVGGGAGGNVALE